MNKKHDFRRRVLILTVFSVLHFCGCRKNVPETEINGFQDLNTPEYTIGAMTGVVATAEARMQLPQAKFKEYSMPADAFTAICSGKIDAVVLDRPTLEYMALAHPELSVMKEDLAVGHISVAAAKRNPALMQQVNGFIRECRKNGVLQQMHDRWFHTMDPEMPEFPLPEKTDGSLKVGITANNVPLAFIKNGKMAGYDCEFSVRLAAALQKEIKFIDIPYDALVVALESGKIDLAVAYMDAVPERAESVLFSEPYVDAPITILLRQKNPAEKEQTSLFRRLAASFEKTFLRENRWQLILRGLAVTMVITFFSVVLGTLLAFPVCMMSRSKNKAAAWLADRYVSLIMGTPILVILMILYYVVFAQVDLHAVFVAILVFAMDFSAYTSVTLRAGIDGIPREQTEAALALGHSPAAAFFRFILPQAVRTVLPVYRSTIISTLKATSIVGYIAIADLTKMGDIIRSRTYEAFFPLIAIAVLYFLTAKILTFLLQVLEKRMTPESRRKRVQKQNLLFKE